jgi:8-oxo-dGTP diphosphatase
MTFTYEYPRPCVTVDCVVFGLDEDELRVLLIQRDKGPFEGKWALPGGFVNMGESLEAAALRELEEESGAKNLFLEQLYTFGDVGRDPRDRVITVAYFALVKMADQTLCASTDARSALWFSIGDLPELAFDHARIVEMAYQRLKAKVRYQPIGFELLPVHFTLTQIQTMYESILNRKLDKRNFRKKILEMDIVVPTGQVQSGVSHRAAMLYQFDKATYDIRTREGFNFEL